MSGSAMTFERYLVGAGVAITVMFTVLDPSPSAGLPFLPRLVFWAMHVLGGLGVLVVVQHVLDRIRTLRQRPWGAVALAGLVGAVLVTPLALAADGWFAIPEDFDGKGLESWSRFGWPGVWIAEATEVAPSMIVTWIVIQLPWLLRLDLRPRENALIDNVTSGGEALVDTPSSDRPPAAPPSGEHAESSPEPTVVTGPSSRVLEPTERIAPASLEAALPTALGNEIVWLTSELHYLRVRTTRGQALVLFNLKDAVREVETRAPGLQIHRSHWVARDHVQRLARRGSGWVCTLTTGDEVPVSRRRAKEAREAFGDAASYVQVAS